MYWLLPERDQEKVRNKVASLTEKLSTVDGNPQADQLFPYVGRKDKRKAIKVIEEISPSNGIIVEPFTGSGSLVYAAHEAGRSFIANEWEPYAHRMSSAPWRLPDKEELYVALDELKRILTKDFNYLYKTVCSCGNDHMLDSLFFDREPLKFNNVTKHERLGPNGENITYRGKHACPKCGATEKIFDKSDLLHLKSLESIKADPIFDIRLIENSRINLSTQFTVYGNLFPHRSKIGIVKLWGYISKLKPNDVKDFLIDAFLSILPQAKYKDYRSKSQDLHCPEKTLREVNIFYRFISQIDKRYEGLNNYHVQNKRNNPIKCEDFRAFFSGIKDKSVDLVFSDPPWCDGNAYFEKAQLYHPWIAYDLSKDKERLKLEFVVTDAPSRKAEHDLERWWKDMAEFFRESYRISKDDSFMALFFRPIPARQWLSNLNRLKLLARQNGFEPLLSIDVDSSDPSMRIQQSAAYVFSQDVIFLFLKLEETTRRHFFKDIDIDQLAFQIAEELQEEVKGPFQYKEWRTRIAEKLNEVGATELNRADKEDLLIMIFNRYCDKVAASQYLPKMGTPFSGQLFDTPAVERFFTYVPHIVNRLTEDGKIFSYDQFLLALSTYVENGTRALISQIQSLDIKRTLEPYAIPIEGGRFFKKRPLPSLPGGIANVMEMDPYDFETFIGKLLSKSGFTNVAVIGRSDDRGVDIIGDDPKGIKTVVQCKRYVTSNVSASPIQRLHSFAITRGAHRRILITTSAFTPAAKTEAKNTKTELITGKELASWIAKDYPEFSKKQKYRDDKAIEKVGLFLSDIIPDQNMGKRDRFKNYLPVYSLEAVATNFGKEEYVDILGWKKIEGKSLNKDMFIAKVVGKSMEPTIPDGSYCLFKLHRAGSRNGLVVLVESKQVADPETNQRFTIKRYSSEKEYLDDGQWRHKKIVLSPDNKIFKDILLENVDNNDFKVVAEFVGILA